MVTFFAIFFVLIIVNVALLVFSSLGTRQKVSELTKSISEQSTAKIYPLDLLTSDYQEAV